MPVTNWIQLSGPKDGTLSETVSVLISGGFHQEVSLSPLFVTGDFPTAPLGANAINGIEIRVSARSSHPGVSISSITWESLWDQANSPFLFATFVATQGVTAPQFDVGTDADLPSTDYIAVGGYNAAIPNQIVSTDHPSLVLSMDDRAHWTGGTLAAPTYPTNPFVLGSHTATINFASADGYNATLYVDAIEVRLHYQDASTAELTGGGTLSASLSKALKINTGLSGGGSIAATMNGMRNIAATLFGDGKVSPSLSRDDGSNVYRYIMPELSGSGSMALVPLIRYAPIAVDLNGSGESSMTLLRGHGVKASAPVAMRFVGLMSQALRRQRVIARNLSGSGVISATVQKQQLIDTDLSGAGTVTIASGGIRANRPVAAAISGVGMVVSTLQRARIAEAQNLIGTGIASATLLARRPIVAAMSGGGTVSALLTSNVRLEAPPGRTFNPPSDFQAFVPPDDFIVFQGD